jgi:hypothetical protein
MDAFGNFTFVIIRYYYRMELDGATLQLPCSIQQGDFTVTVANLDRRASRPPGFLLGLAWNAKRVAEDPIITSTPTMRSGRHKGSASGFAGGGRAGVATATRGRQPIRGGRVQARPHGRSAIHNQMIA